MEPNAGVAPASIANNSLILKITRDLKLMFAWLGKIFACTALSSAVAAAASQSKSPPLTPLPNTVFLCKDGGQDIYTNTKLNKNCKGYLLGAAPPPPNTPAGGATPPLAPPATGATTFPKVSASAQTERDTDRKRILNEEMIAEQKSLDLAKKELAQQEAKALSEEKNYKKITERLQPFKEVVAQHDRNVQALRKELANVK